MKREIIVGCLILTLFLGCSDKRQYDFSFEKSYNQYGVTFYKFHHFKAPPVDLLPDNDGIKDITQINEILKHIEEPPLNASMEYRQVPKNIFVWDNYEKGELAVTLRDGKYKEGDKKTYSCISRLRISPNPKEKMINQAQNSDTRIFVSKETFGDKWPLTVDYGIIECKRGNAIIFWTEDHHGFAVNGIAKSMNGYENIHKIWKDDPNIPGLKISIDPLIKEGLKVCE